ncbi:hypothetical protein MTR67_017614 [Solanum verrucosum]|uniref:Tf2-1-like SH3-like domain-containing protein n=1 Tax=Solanum verrucosum TaxID=315347 RepID=A0AAF0QQM0_SOLVR|nr:hypothetical protein MTR67_017614 [Solanum verrucosum]
MKGVMRFGKKGKLSSRYVSPYRIFKRIGKVAYELELPQELAAVHPVFHVSMLKKCIGDTPLIIPTENIGIKDSLSYEEIHIQILDRQVRKLRTKEVASVKVLWRNQFVGEPTWEAEEDMKKRYPHLFEFRENADQEMICEKTKMPLNFRTDYLPTAQLSKGITRSYELGIEQTRWRWKDRSKGFPNITGTTPRSS